ncbi:F-box/kelch-repeat protein SKIP6-like [Phoenix dactylifera]|uniref:F-box/kelch-repeat protein SKIP6-like n=1 Tax=Phoenix dactylifera TaxID=42345 RepID=A0A8B7BLJ6_PHODC|nr:F-box/kelch-repeat protein SKIP6-like [Phoenix dactylifera]
MTDSLDGSPAGPLIPQLPDDLSIRCIARVPRSSHSALALVSRSWRSLLRSPLFFALRSDLGALQPFLCLNVRTPTDQSCWYLLDPADRWNPILLPAPQLPTVGSACAALGSTLFVLGGSLHGVPSAAVQLFDACRRRWSLGPRMSAAREFAAAGALGGRIYVIGGCLPPADAWAEALDPACAAWSTVPSPPHLREKWMHGSAVLAGRLLAVADRGGVVYDPAAEVPWRPVPAALDLGWRGRAAVVGGILYSYDYLGKIRGYDLETDEWKQVEGLERELPKFLCGATLANLGGLLCVVWEGKRRGRSGSKEMEIEWAGIEVLKTDDGGLQGSIVWSESIILAVPKRSSVAHCVAVEL